MSENLIALLIVATLCYAAYQFKALRKAIGLLLVILGGLACFTFVGIVIGIPMILVGGLLLFI